MTRVCLFTGRGLPQPGSDCAGGGGEGGIPLLPTKGGGGTPLGMDGTWKGYAAGGTPLAVSPRRTFVFKVKNKDTINCWKFSMGKVRPSYG